MLECRGRPHERERPEVPPTHTHTVRLTLHAHITLDVSHTVWLVGVCCRGPRPPHIQTHRRSTARLDKHGGEQGDGGGFTKKAGSCGGGQRKLAVPAWQSSCELLRRAKASFRLRSARLPRAPASAPLSARRTPLWFRVGPCPPWLLSLSGRLAPPSRPLGLTRQTRRQIQVWKQPSRWSTR